MINSNDNQYQMYCSQTSLENSEIDSSTRSTSSLNLLGLALKRYEMRFVQCVCIRSEKICFFRNFKRFS